MSGAKHDNVKSLIYRNMTNPNNIMNHEIIWKAYPTANA